MKRAATVILTAAVLGSGLGLTGCVTERVGTRDGLPSPARPKAAPAQPTGLAPSRMTLMIGAAAADSDGDRYPDTIGATTSIFSDQHPLPLDVDGQFTFELYREGEAGKPDSEPLATWTFAGDQVAAARARAQWGVSYRFRLALSAAGVDDRMPLTGADLRAFFTDAASGVRVDVSDDPRPIRLGR